MFDFFLYPHFLLPERDHPGQGKRHAAPVSGAIPPACFLSLPGRGEGSLVVTVISVACLAKIRIKVGMGKAKRQRDAGGKWRLTVSGLTSPALEKTVQGLVFSKVRIEKTKVRIVFGEGLMGKLRPL